MPKKLKDENAPPRPLTPYFAWMKDNRAKIKGENPSISNKELTKVLGAAWKSASDDDKKPYIDAARVAMDAWKTKMAAYKQTDDYANFMAKKRAQQNEGKGKKGKKAKAPKDPNQPKRPSTGFFLFVQDHRAKVKAELPPQDQKKVTLVTKKCGEMWKDPANKSLVEEYQAKAKSLKAEWDDKMKAYKQTAQYKEFQEQLEDWKEEQKQKNKSKGRAN